MDYNDTYILSKREKILLKTIILNSNVNAGKLRILLELKGLIFSNIYSLLTRLVNNNYISATMVKNTKVYNINENFLKDNPNFLETMELKNEKKLKELKKKREIEEFPPFEYDQSYVLTTKEKEIVKELILHPGLNVKELATIFCVGASAISNKVTILKKHKIIYCITKGRKKFLYVNRNFMKENPNFLETMELRNADKLKEQILQEDKEKIEKLSQEEYDQSYILTPKEKQLVKELILHPGLCVKELAAIFRVGISAISNKVTILKKHKIIYCIIKGRKSFYYFNNNILKENPNFLETMELRNANKLKEQILQENKEKIEKLSQEEYDHSYIFTSKEKELIKELILHPGLCVKELAAIFRVGTSAISNKVTILKKHKIIYCITKGRNKFLYVNKNFLKDNHDFLETMDLSLLIALIKNVLFNSTNIHAKTILDNFEFFLSFFSFIEILQLLFILNICNFENLKNEDVENKRALLIKYQNACLYISNIHKEEEISKNSQKLRNRFQSPKI